MTLMFCQHMTFEIGELTTVNARTAKDRTLSILRDVVQAGFVRDSTAMHYKKDFDGEELSVSFMKKAAENTLNRPPSQRQNCRGISTAKKAKILNQLVTRMPANRRQFWQGLPENETSEDLLHNSE